MRKVEIPTASNSTKVLLSFAFLFPVAIFTMIPILLWKQYDSTFQKYSLVLFSVVLSAFLIYLWLKNMKEFSTRIIVTPDGLSIEKKGIITNTIGIEDISCYGISNYPRISSTMYSYFCSVPQSDIMRYYFSNKEHALSIYNSVRLNADALDITDDGRWLMAVDYYLHMHEDCDPEDGAIIRVLNSIEKDLPSIYKLWRIKPTITGTWSLENKVFSKINN